MKKKFFIFLSSITYVVFVLGFIFHKSAHPVILGRYTIFYTICVIILILFFFPFVWGIHFITKKSTIVLNNKKKLTLGPIHKIIFFVFIFFIYIFLPFEVFLRIKYRNVESNYYRYTIENFHPFLGQQLTQQDNLHINSYGFRGEEITQEKPENTHRIFVLGGSTVLNSGVEYEKNVVRLLEKKLKQKYPKKNIQVLNAGNDWYTTQHSLIQYLFKIKDFHPDLIIMWHGINDMYHSCNSPEFFTKKYEPDYSHGLGPVSRMVRAYFQPKPLVDIKSLAIDFTYKILQKNLYSDFISYDELRKYRFDSAQEKNQYNLKQYPSLDAYQRNIESLIELTKQDSVKLILGNQPFLYKNHLSPTELHSIIFPRLLCTNDNKYPTIQSVKDGITVFNDKVKNVANEKNIPFIDFSSQIPKNLTYFTDDVHFSIKGNERMSEVLFDFITKNNRGIDDDK